MEFFPTRKSLRLVWKAAWQPRFGVSPPGDVRGVSISVDPRVARLRSKFFLEEDLNPCGDRIAKQCWGDTFADLPQAAQSN